MTISPYVSRSAASTRTEEEARTQQLAHKFEALAYSLETEAKKIAHTEAERMRYQHEAAECRETARRIREGMR